MELLKQITIFEGQGPVPVMMTLDEIIRDGKASNGYQVYVLGWLSEFFKNGLKSAALHLESPITFESHATRVDTVTAIKGMSPEAQVNLAEYLKDCIIAGETALKDPSCSVVDWIRYVLRKQD
jgi:hypothetical protein